MAKKAYPTAKGWKQKEAHVMVLKVTDSAGADLNVSAATIQLWCKRKLNDVTTYLFEKADGDFTKTVDGNTNWVSVNISEANLNFFGEAFIITQFVIDVNNSPICIVRLDLEQTPE